MNTINAKNPLFNPLYFLTSLCFASLFLLQSCNYGVEEIKSRQKNCDHCHMNIVDMRFNSQSVNTKAKHKHYDSIECLFTAFARGDIVPDAKLYVTNIKSLDSSPSSTKNKKSNKLNKYQKKYQNKYIEAKQAYYLHSSSFPSPMGANLSAYGRKEDVQNYLKDHAGDLFSFEDTLKYVKEINGITE